MRILIFIFLFLSTTVQASFEMNERMKHAYNHIIGLEFDAADKLLNKGTPRPDFNINDYDYKMIDNDRLYELFKNQKISL